MQSKQDNRIIRIGRHYYLRLTGPGCKKVARVTYDDLGAKLAGSRVGAVWIDGVETKIPKEV